MADSLHTALRDVQFDVDNNYNGTEMSLGLNGRPPLIINLDTREIEDPSGVTNFFSVSQDQMGTTINFEVDRYYEDVDLASMVCVIEFINAEGEGCLYPIVMKDTTSEPGKIKFGWCLGYMATKKAGPVQFDIRFYRLDKVSGEFLFSLRTLPQEGYIQEGLPHEELGNEAEEYYASEIVRLYDAINSAGRLYWTDV